MWFADKLESKIKIENFNKWLSNYRRNYYKRNKLKGGRLVGYKWVNLC